MPPAAFPFSRTAAALAAWQRNASEAARWAHPSWWAPALDVPPATACAAFDALRDALASTRAAALAACSRALLRAADVALPSFDSLRAPNPAVLDALPVEVGLRVLRMRALLLRRAEVRRLIDKQSRRRLAHWVGVPLERLAFAPGQGAAHAALGNEWAQAAPGNELARLLADMPADLPTKVSAKAPRYVPANAPDVARLVARGDLPPLDEIDDERLAYEGYALLARDMQEAAWSQKLAAAEPQGARNRSSDDPREGLHEGLREAFREGPHERPHEGLREGVHEGLRERLQEGLRERPHEGLRDAPHEGPHERPHEGPPDDPNEGRHGGLHEEPHEAHHHKHASQPSHPHPHPSAAARPCPLLRLALPRDLPPPWPSASARELDVGGTALLLAQLPELLPEWAWLFG